MSRKFLTFCMMALLIFACANPVFARDFDPQKNGSISVALTAQDKTPIIGAQLSIYHIATVDINMNGELNYTYTSSFECCGIELDDPNLSLKLDGYISENEPPMARMQTNAQGNAICKDLPLGLYFVRQTNTVDGFAPCVPFIVTIPMDTNGYVYEVNASPKTEVVRLTSITIKKVWNTDPSTKPAESVTVQLLRNGNVIKTATLNEKNNWQITYTDMPQSDAYTIQEVNIPNDFTATYKQDAYVFTVTNTSTLPQTGQLIWPIPILAFIGVLLIATGSVLLQKKRE